MGYQERYTRTGRSMNSLYYLVYVHRGEIKIRRCRRSLLCHTCFIPVEGTTKYRQHTQIPDNLLQFQHGKIYCEKLEDLDFCINIIKEHYKDRVLLLERSLNHSRSVIGEYDG